MKDEIYYLVNEIEQCFIGPEQPHADDRNSAEYAIRSFLEKKLEQYKKLLRDANRKNELLIRETNHAYQTSQDYIPHPEES